MRSFHPDAGKTLIRIKQEALTAGAHQPPLSASLKFSL